MYILLVFLVLFFLMGASIYLITGIISIFLQSPYVPTSDDAAYQILKHAQIKRGQSFLDLGAGDGRVVYIAQHHFRLRATGVEANPLLCIYARVRYHVHLRRQNLFSASLKHADIIYIYLFPKLIAQLEPHLLKQCKKGTLVVSYTFPIKGLVSHLTDTVKIGNKCAFYYTI